MKTVERFFYLCNGKMWCNKRADGRRNEYCQANALDTDYCYHTTNKDFRKHKDGNNFKIIESEYGDTHYIDHIEMDNKYDEDFYKRKVEANRKAELEILEKGGYDDD